MATIKTTGTGTGLRILTKTASGIQRVSCTCCEGSDVCCVFPAACGKGPSSVLFYDQILNETSAGSLTYGDSENGVALIGGAWTIYRNSQTRTQSCLGMGANAGLTPPSVQANLASSYGVAVTFESAAPFSTTVSYYGISIAEDGGFAGQCGWSGYGGGGGGITDEGIGILFNKDTCRWELQNGPLNFLYAFLSGSEQKSPIGNYTVVADGQSGPITTLVVT